MMSDKPSLQLGDPPSRLVGRRSSLPGVWLLGFLQILTLVAVGLLLTGSTPKGSGGSGPERLDRIRATAIALEDRSLAAEAASAWRDYLALSPAAADRAPVLYRIGRLLLDAEDFSGAVSALIEAQQLVGEEEDIHSKAGVKIVECLRRLGSYGEVGRELSRQVEVGGSESAQGKVLARFAGETFTEADLDRMIERTIDRLLAMQPGGQFQLGREQLLSQYESGEARERALHDIIQRELFSRRARELKIDREEAFQQARDFFETELLASHFLSRELTKIQPSDVDVESFYAAHRSDYRRPETASVVVLPLSGDQASEDFSSAIQSAEAFRSLIGQAGADEDTASIRIVEGQSHLRLGDTAALFELAEGDWTRTPLTVGDEKILVLVESKTPATTPPLSQIRLRVEADYRRRKYQELTQKLSGDLMSRYDVQIVAPPSDESVRSSSAGDGSKEESAMEDPE